MSSTTSLSLRSQVRDPAVTVTKPMAGTIPSEGHRSSAASVNPNAQPQANGVQHADILPVTKVPALDTIDPYAVEKPLGEVVANSPWAELLCSADVQDVADDLIQGYSRFISNFTGLEDVAFLLARHPAAGTASDTVRDVVCASVFWSESTQRPGDLSTCTIRHVDERLYNQDEIQFSLDLRASSDPENGEKQLSTVQENVGSCRAAPVAI